MSKKTRYSGIALGYLQRCALACLLAGETVRPFNRNLGERVWQYRNSYKASWENFLERLQKAGLEIEHVYIVRKDKVDKYQGIKLTGFRSHALKAVFEMQVQQILGPEIKFR